MLDKKDIDVISNKNNIIIKMINKLIKGDNIEIMKSIDENYVDLIITYINNIDSMNIHISTL